MNNRACGDIAELLVDYADGELPEAHAARVAAHLAECPGCRAELRLLERSLELARAVWAEGARGEGRGARDEGRDSRARQFTAASRKERRRMWAAVCVAAGFGAVLAAAGPWLAARLRSSPEEQIPQSVAQGPTPQAVEDVDVEALIAREARSARLAVAAELLGTQPGLEQYHAEAQRYLSQHYAGTRAAERAAPPAPTTSPATDSIQEPKS